MRRSWTQQRHAISGAFVFLLLGIFAVSAALLTLLGAQAYRGAVTRSAGHNDARVLTAYLRNAIRSEDAKGALEIRNMDGMDALVFRSTLEGEGYQKFIYVHDGALKELFIAADRPFDPEEGQEICPAQALRAEKIGNLMEIEIVDGEGRTIQVDAALKCPS